MSEPAESERGLERSLGRILRDLPLRRAPATLQSRVLAELARRAALPWWRRSFAHWPRAARTAFVSMSAVLGGLALAGGGWAVSGIKSLQGFGVLSVPGVRHAAVALHIAQWGAGELARAVPPDWIYCGLAVGAALYATLFALGATGYRMLLLQHETAGEF